MEITERESPTTKSALRKELKEITTYVAEQLNNTPGVCKSAYIDDMFWDWVQEIRK
jgi:DNA topoisomerase IB